MTSELVSHGEAAPVFAASPAITQTLPGPPCVRRRGGKVGGIWVPPRQTPPPPLLLYSSPSQRVCVSSKPGLCPRPPLWLWLCFFPNPSCYSGARFLTSNNTFPPLPSLPTLHHLHRLPPPLPQVCCRELRTVEVGVLLPPGGERRMRLQAGR